MRKSFSAQELWAGAIFLSVVLPAPVALAAPFCLETPTVPPQCIYDDAGNCRREAIHQGGGCVINPAEITANPGIGEYCVATSGGATSCNYADITTCARAAAHENAVCIPAPPSAAGNVPNPYRYLTEPE